MKLTAPEPLFGRTQCISPFEYRKTKLVEILPAGLKGLNILNLDYRCATNWEEEKIHRLIDKSKTLNTPDSRNLKS